jgi:hypothetical protein
MKPLAPGSRVSSDGIRGTVTRVERHASTGANQTESIYVNWDLPAAAGSWPMPALAGSWTR